MAGWLKTQHCCCCGTSKMDWELLQENVTAKRKKKGKEREIKKEKNHQKALLLGPMSTIKS